MGAAIGQPDRTSTLFLMGWLGGGLNFVGAVRKLLGFGQQQVRSRIKSDVLKPFSLLAHMPRFF